MPSADFVKMFTADNFAEVCESYFSYEKVVECIKALNYSNDAQHEHLVLTLKNLVDAKKCEDLAVQAKYIDVAFARSAMASVKYSNKAWQILIEYAKGAAVEGVANSLKNSGKYSIGRAINRGITKAQNKLTAPITKRIGELQQEMDFLEISLLAYAMCLHKKGLYIEAMSKLDEAVGVHLSPWMNIWDSIARIVTSLHSQSLGDFLRSRFTLLEGAVILKYGWMYYDAMNAVAKAGNISDIAPFPNYARMKELDPKRYLGR